MDKVEGVKPQAEKNIQDIEDRHVLWKFSHRLSLQHQSPSRFGIVTSNTSESINDMFTGARNLPRMGTLEHLVNLMSSCICRLQTLYSKVMMENCVKSAVTSQCAVGSSSHNDSARCQGRLRGLWTS
jgi:hypothetical protein